MRVGSRLEGGGINRTVRHHRHPKLLHPIGVFDATSRCLAHLLHRFNNLFDVPRGYFGAPNIDDIGSAPDKTQDSIIGEMPDVTGIEPLVSHGATLEVDIREGARSAIADDAV